MVQSADAEPATALPRVVRLGVMWRKGRFLPYFYMAPFLFLLAIFIYWPFVYTVVLSFVEWNFIAPDMKLVGFANYDRVISSSLFNDAMSNTAWYVIGSIPFKVLLPIPVAIFIWSLGSGRMSISYKTIIFLPTLLSFTVVAILWLWMLNPFIGTFTLIFRQFGAAFPNMLAEQSALWTILGISAWKIIGFNVLLYLAGLARINRDYIDAMRMDGARDSSILRHLIWPLLTPTTFFVLIATVIFSIQQVFTPIDIMTQGGPSNSTTNLFYMVYQFAFQTFKVGYGAAGTVLLFAVLIAITVIKFKLLDRRVRYDQ